MKLNSARLTIALFFVSVIIISCKKNEAPPITPPPVPAFLLKAYPAWTAAERCFLKGESSSFDGVSVKDPSIVFFDNKWHLFYTGRDSSRWRMGYSSATTIEGLKNATRTYMTTLNGGFYFCAPQIMYLSTQKKWYLIYQSGLGATFSTNTAIDNPSGWSRGATMGFTDGIDFWCIADESRVYCFYSAQDGSRNIKVRSTSINDFPYKWSDFSVAATETFEASHVYKNKTDGNYYMMVEDMARHFELWKATKLGGPWTKMNERWASKTTLTETAGHWTDQVSHGEILRSGVDEKCEIDDINTCKILIQGVVNGNYGDYGNIPYELGIIKNF